MNTETDWHVASVTPTVSPSDTTSARVEASHSLAFRLPKAISGGNCPATESGLYAWLLHKALSTLVRVADRDIHGMDMRSLREEAQITVGAIQAALVAREEER